MSASAATTTLILGAGFGGISTANALRRRLVAAHRVVLVEKTPSFHFGATKPWVMLGQKTAAEVSYRRDALKSRGIELIEAEARRIDLDRGEVATTLGLLRADYLVIALGADYDMTQVPGLEQAAHEFYTLDGATRLCEALRGFERGDLVILIPRAPFKCPPAPYEAAMLLHHALQLRGVRDQARIAVHTVEGAPMATAGPEMGKFIRDQLALRGIAYHPGRKTARIDAARHAIHFDDGSEANYDLLVAVPPHVAPVVVREASLTNQSGWIPADPRTLQVRGRCGFCAVFGVGDVCVVPLPGRHKPDVPLVLPKAGTVADGQGQAVAAQIAAQALGGAAEDFGGLGACYVETGAHNAFKGEADFYALPHPAMRATAPDHAQYQGKLAWMAGWLRDNLQEVTETPPG